MLPFKFIKHYLLPTSVWSCSIQDFVTHFILVRHFLEPVCLRYHTYLQQCIYIHPGSLNSVIISFCDIIPFSTKWKTQLEQTLTVSQTHCKAIRVGYYLKLCPILWVRKENTHHFCLVYFANIADIRKKSDVYQCFQIQTYNSLTTPHWCPDKPYKLFTTMRNFF